jgi:hypothetical protein
MGWRKMMNVETGKTISKLKSNNSDNSNIQEKPALRSNIADIADIAPMNQKVKNPQQRFDSLWQKAWKLADWIDDSKSVVPRQKRAAKVPELQEMSAKLDQLEALTKVKKKNNISRELVTEIDLKFLEGFSPIPEFTEPKQYQQDNCPARCKRTGRCYGKVCFSGKPGKAEPCKSDQCLWNNQLKTNGKYLSETMLKI